MTERSTEDRRAGLRRVLTVIRRFVVAPSILALIVTIGVPVLRAVTGSTLSGWQTIHTPPPPAMQAQYDNFDAVRRQFHSQLPAGAVLIVGELSLPTPDDVSTWQQRIVELGSVEGFRFTLDRTRAQYEVSVVTDPTHADRIVLKAVRLS